MTSPELIAAVRTVGGYDFLPEAALRTDNPAAKPDMRLSDEEAATKSGLSARACKSANGPFVPDGESWRGDRFRRLDAVAPRDRSGDSPLAGITLRGGVNAAAAPQRSD
jgi:hypothetical protein